MKLYQPESIAAADRETIQRFGVPGAALMEHAGAEAFRLLTERFGVPASAVVLAGPGNNGGDGYVVARWLKAEGTDVSVLSSTRLEDLNGDAATMAAAWKAVGGRTIQKPASKVIAQTLKTADLVIDALFGTGLRRPVEGVAYRLIQQANQLDVPVVALDIPSGISGRDGLCLGDIAIEADLTVTFGMAKTGLFIRPGADHVGRVEIAALGFGPWVKALRSTDAVILDSDEPLCHLEIPKSDLHKSSAGRVLVVGGSSSMPGAAALAGRGALRAGAGLVTVTTESGTELTLDALMRLPAINADDSWDVSLLPDAIARVDACVVGPGLGRSETVVAAIRSVLTNASGPVVIDADALQALAQNKALLRGVKAPRILTPHTREAAVLLGWTDDEVESSRRAAVETIAKTYRCVALLKGPDTLISDGKQLYISNSGNEALATGGSGDVLAGAIAALCASGYTPIEAAARAAYFHGLAAQKLSEQRRRGWVADEIADTLADVYFG